MQVQIVSALAVFERIFEYLDMKPEGDEKPDAIVLGNVRGDVAFDDVHFAYSADRVALDGVSFHIAAGTDGGVRRARRAPARRRSRSSSRASTTRSRAASASTDIDVRDVTLASLRENIGIVTQETYLFHDTIAANLRYAARRTRPTRR